VQHVAKLRNGPQMPGLSRDGVSLSKSHRYHKLYLSNNKEHREKQLQHKNHM